VLPRPSRCATKFSPLIIIIIIMRWIIVKICISMFKFKWLHELINFGLNGMYKYYNILICFK
jgi:hypothetical protein